MQIYVTTTRTLEQSLTADEARALLKQPDWTDEQVLATVNNPDSWTHELDERLCDQNEAYDSSFEVDASAGEAESAVPSPLGEPAEPTGQRIKITHTVTTSRSVTVDEARSILGDDSLTAEQAASCFRGKSFPAEAYDYMARMATHEIGGAVTLDQEFQSAVI